MEAEEQQETADVSHQLSGGLAAVNVGNVTSSAVPLAINGPPAISVAFNHGISSAPVQPTVTPASGFMAQPVATQQPPSTVFSPFGMPKLAPQLLTTGSTTVGGAHQVFNNPPLANTTSSPAVNSPTPIVPMRISNPWAADGASPQPHEISPPVVATVHATPSSSGKVSEAEFWLNSTANQIDPFACAPNIGTKQASMRARGTTVGSVVNGSAAQSSSVSPVAHAASTVVVATVHHQGTTGVIAAGNTVATAPKHNLSSLNNSAVVTRPTVHASTAPLPDKHAVPQQHIVIPFGQDSTQQHQQLTRYTGPASTTAFDPFESAWAAKSSSRAAVGAGLTSTAVAGLVPVFNPFQTSSGDQVKPAFQVQL
jgi:hypothetical protein